MAADDSYASTYSNRRMNDDRLGGRDSGSILINHFFAQDTFLTSERGLSADIVRERILEQEVVDPSCFLRSRTIIETYKKDYNRWSKILYLEMKSMKMFFRKQYTTRPSQGNETINDLPRSSSSLHPSNQSCIYLEIASTTLGEYLKIYDNNTYISYGSDGPNPDGS
ncbi:hypothetical protein LguiA_027210 [Lonicera macranthoides]